jgi:hypothetical protein
MPIVGRPRTGWRHSLQPVGLYIAEVRVATIQADVVPPAFENSEEGDVTNATVAVNFSEAVFSANFAVGVTIKINGIAATITSATKQSDPVLVYYVLQTPYSDANDLITFEYSDVAGDYADLVGNQMGDVVATSVTNNVGRHLRFNDAPNSMHLAWL